jgi:hypothetical protein
LERRRSVLAPAGGGVSPLSYVLDLQVCVGALLIMGGCLLSWGRADRGSRVQAVPQHKVDLVMVDRVCR